jgi:DNA invertase Pin-like site-specific DNA recombinase
LTGSSGTGEADHGRAAALPTPTADPERATRRAVIYLRATREDGPCVFSLDGQRLAITAYVAASGDLHVVDEYVDRAESGGRRPAWHRLITAGIADRFDVVLVFHTSRISRAPLVATHYTRLLCDELGIAVVSVAELADPVAYLKGAVPERGREEAAR